MFTENTFCLIFSGNKFYFRSAKSYESAGFIAKRNERICPENLNSDIIIDIFELRKDKEEDIWNRKFITETKDL